MIRLAIVASLLAACTSSSTSRYEAATMLADAYCIPPANSSKQQVDASCAPAVVFGFCPDGDVGFCAGAVTSEELLDSCIERTSMRGIPADCWALFDSHEAP